MGKGSLSKLGPENQSPDRPGTQVHAMICYKANINCAKGECVYVGICMYLKGNLHVVEVSLFLFT